jgi:hypothetical protein
MSVPPVNFAIIEEGLYRCKAFRAGDELFVKVVALVLV